MIGLITGNHPRHLFLANRLIETGLVQCWVIEKRENFTPDSSFIINKELRDLFDLHFQKREQAEEHWFGKRSYSPKDIDSITINENEQNSDFVKKFFRKYSCDFIMSYGCHILDEEVLSLSNYESINIHGGLSPWYKGVITHFWPSYNLEPELTGMTLHKLTKKIDGGSIIHQTKADLVLGDGLHKHAGRVVSKFVDELSEMAPLLLEQKKFLPSTNQKKTGRLWTGTMWRPEHLLVIYKHFEDKVVDFCIENSISSNIKESELIYFQPGKNNE